jgi:hypothetical protein
MARRHPDAAEHARLLGIDLGAAKVLGMSILGAAGESPAKRSKYGAKATIYGGIRYDSKAEAKRAEYLDSLAPAGVWYVRQPTFRLGCPENVYRADFLVVSGPGGGVHVEDVKGHETEKFARDKRLWAAYGRCELRIIRGGKMVQVIRPKEDE